MGNELLSIQSHNWVTSFLTRLYLRGVDRHYSHLLYSYLRSLDDFVDEKDRSRTDKEEFISRQRRIIESVYGNPGLDPNSSIASIIRYDLDHGLKLKAPILRMLEIFEFDAGRKNTIVSFEALNNYSVTLGNAYTQILLYFLSPKYEYHQENSLLAHACHQAHVLRDLKRDEKLGYINISKEEIAQYDIHMERIPDDNFQKWLEDKIRTIQGIFSRGKIDINKIPILRLKVIANLYCFRYETFLHQIKETGYPMKDGYPIRVRDAARLVLTLFSLVFKHLRQIAWG